MDNSMYTNADTTWDRYALIVDIVERFHKASHRLGKTALQKMIYLLQESFGVDCDYSYTLYTYGPYSSDVARDLDIVAGFGGAEMKYDWALSGYEIFPGPASADLRSRAADFLESIAPRLERLVADFGGFTARDLELRSTIIYLSRPGLARTDLVTRVHDVKPHFTPSQIDAAMTELDKKRYLGQTATANARN